MIFMREEEQKSAAEQHAEHGPARFAESVTELVGLPLVLD